MQVLFINLRGNAGMQIYSDVPSAAVSLLIAVVLDAIGQY